MNDQPLGSFKSEITQQFFMHWRGLCKDGSIPTTEDYLDRFEPRLMPIVFMFDHLDTDLIIRYQGAQIVARWGANYTNQSWLTMNLFLPHDKVLANTRDCVLYRCGSLSESIFVTSAGRRIRLENLMLPLKAQGDRPARLVVVSSFLDTITESDGTKDVVEPLVRDWFDAGFGRPPHAIRTRET